MVKVRKWAAVLLVLVLAVGLCACSIFKPKPKDEDIRQLATEYPVFPYPQWEYDFSIRSTKWQEDTMHCAISFSAQGLYGTLTGDATLLLAYEEDDKWVMLNGDDAFEERFQNLALDSDLNGTWSGLFVEAAMRHTDGAPAQSMRLEISGYAPGADTFSAMCTTVTQPFLLSGAYYPPENHTLAYTGQVTFLPPQNGGITLVFYDQDAYAAQGTHADAALSLSYTINTGRLSGSLNQPNRGMNTPVQLAKGDAEFVQTGKAAHDYGKIIESAVFGRLDAETLNMYPIVAGPNDDGHANVFDAAAGFVEEDMETYAISLSSIVVRSYCIAIVKPAEGRSQAVAEQMQSYIQQQKNSQENYLPDQYAVASAAQVREMPSGELVLVMCENGDAVMEAIQSAFEAG